jgi:NitT/TauT family transport system permease protein
MEKAPLSRQTVEPSAIVADTSEIAHEPRAETVRGGFGVARILAPAVAAVVALLVHRLLPNKQITLPTRLYPLLLQVLLGSALLLAITQWAWRPLREWTRHYGPLLAGAIFVLCIWDLITLKLAWMMLPFFPGPDMVFQAIWDDRMMLLDSAYRSLLLLMTGYFTGAALGFVSGVLMGWFGEVRYWGMPVMKLIGPTPATALAPLAMVLFPSFFLCAAALIAFAVWFPVTMLTMSGIRNVPVSYFDVARTLGARRSYLIFRIAIPAAMPSIFIGLFIGLLVSFLTLIVAETLGVKNGLGYYVLWKKGYAEYDKVFGSLLISALFFSSLLTLLFKIRDWLLSWQKGVIKW